MTQQATQAITIRLAKAADLEAVCTLLSCGQQRQVQQRIQQQTVLLATTGLNLHAVSGLDLECGEIADWIMTDRPGDTFLARRLIAATERLAVRFGVLQLEIRVPEETAPLFNELGYRPGQKNQPGTRPPLWTRSLRRRQTRYGRRVSAICNELGIPSDYGRRHRLPLQEEASQLSSIGTDVFGREQRLRPAAARAWERMKSAARNAGVELQAVSAWRSVDYQRGLVQRKISQGQTLQDILQVSAAPGYSEHHTGCAIDITTPAYPPLEQEFENSLAFQWLMDHANTMRFRLSYPLGNYHRLAYEPWHWCFQT